MVSKNPFRYELAPARPPLPLSQALGVQTLVLWEEASLRASVLSGLQGWALELHWPPPQLPISSGDSAIPGILGSSLHQPGCFLQLGGYLCFVNLSPSRKHA